MDSKDAYWWTQVDMKERFMDLLNGLVTDFYDKSNLCSIWTNVQVTVGTM
jgi:hypothetical protein